MRPVRASLVSAITGQPWHSRAALCRLLRGSRLLRLACASVTLVCLTAGCGSSKSSLPQPSRTAAEPETAPIPTVAAQGTVLHIGDTPEGVTIDDAIGDAVVALRKPDSIALVRLHGAPSVRVIATPGPARHLRLASPSGPLLLPSEDGDALYEISLPSGAIAARYATGRQPHDAVEVDGHVWTTDELAGNVSILAAGINQTLPAGLQPGGLDTAAGRVAVADVRGNVLYVFDAKTRRQVALLPAGAGPTHVIRVGPSTVAVADPRGNAVLLYDLSGHPRQLFRLPLNGGPYGLAADPARHELWVALSGRNQLVQIHVDGGKLRTTGLVIPTVQQPNSVAVSLTSGALVVAGATMMGTLQLLKLPTG